MDVIKISMKHGRRNGEKFENIYFPDIDRLFDKINYSQHLLKDVKVEHFFFKMWLKNNEMVISISRIYV